MANFYFCFHIYVIERKKHGKKGESNEMSEVRSNWANKKEWLGLVVSVIIISILLDLTGVGCPIRYVTGISCAGCGMTRAWKSVLHLDFMRAFYYHPLYWAVPIMGGLYLVRNRFRKKQVKVIFGIFVAMFCLVYLIRLCDRNNTVVTAEVRSGLLGRYIQGVFESVTQ